ncbi:hypothetical protein AV955_gp031 [Diadromus pulchellus ascovirus 4a]|uniref:Complete DpAV4 genome n=1 Tax=Diadromus pulchellus ascovirus 4a TaxID=158683 RepID=F2NYW0_9VIRU|nr:hypothetical protein AV955_gp031 [Diadromus pulchellus ascovirus 4a]CCA61388.1 unnamed protein product [Diadromus pulchellus ascovirus 4a]
MSSMIQNDHYRNFLGYIAACQIKNAEDFKPLQCVLESHHIKRVRKPYIKFADIFCQTMIAEGFGNTGSRKMETELASSSVNVVADMIPPIVCLREHIEAKEFMTKTLPPHFCVKARDVSVKIVNDRVFMVIKFSEPYKRLLSQITQKINEIYDIKVPRKHYHVICIGYTRETFEKISGLEKTLESLIPSVIYFNSPNVFFHETVDELYPYTNSLF